MPVALQRIAYPFMIMSAGSIANIVFVRGTKDCCTGKQLI